MAVTENQKHDAQHQYTSANSSVERWLQKPGFEKAVSVEVERVLEEELVISQQETRQIKAYLKQIKT